MAEIMGRYELSKPIRKKIGGWVEMDFEAYFTYRGIMWFRPKGGGLGGDGHHSREDWLANTPGIAISAGRSVNHGHDVTKVGWGFNKDKTLEEEMDKQIHDKISWAAYRIKGTREKLAELEHSHRMLVNAETND